MRLTKFKETIVSEDDLVAAIYSGKLTDFPSLLLDDTDLVKQFNNAVTENAEHINKLELYKESTETQEEFDKRNQKQWFMPNDYCPNLVEFLYGQCTTDEQTDRVSSELELFIQHGMFDLLFYLKYLVDTMRENKIVWGVGRGSSVASYVLYLIGVHKIDSLKYNLDINEFLK